MSSKFSLSDSQKVSRQLDGKGDKRKNDDETSSSSKKKSIEIQCRHKTKGVQCQEMFLTWELLKTHYKSAHNKSFFCEEPNCHQACARKNALDIHQRSHSGDKPFKCTEANCDYSTGDPSALAKHLRGHSGEKNHVCDFKNCDYSTSFSSHLIRHKRIHSGEKPYKCDFKNCDYASSDPSALVRHKRIHSGEKPYKCDYKNCNYSSGYNFHITIHKLIHFPPTFDCPSCHELFTLKVSLATHINNNSCRLLSCPDAKCEKKFREQKHVDNHVKWNHSPVKEVKKTQSQLGKKYDEVEYSDSIMKLRRKDIDYARRFAPKFMDNNSLSADYVSLEEATPLIRNYCLNFTSQQQNDFLEFLRRSELWTNIPFYYDAASNVQSGHFVYIYLNTEQLQEHGLLEENTESSVDNFFKFLSCILYIGRGTGPRREQHLFWATQKHEKKFVSTNNYTSLVSNLEDFLNRDVSITLTRVYATNEKENSLAVESCLISAIGSLENLLNKKRGDKNSVGQMSSDGVFLLDEEQVGTFLLLSSFEQFLAKDYDTY